MSGSIPRRAFQTMAAQAAVMATQWSRFAHATWSDAPTMEFGSMVGEVTSDTAVLWNRTDQPASLLIEWETVSAASPLRGSAVGRTESIQDGTCHTLLRGLPAGERIRYRIAARNASGAQSDWMTGSFTTSSNAHDDVFFAWSGDTAGQGFGINLEWGGMRIYDAIAQLQPQFFVHSGDMIYADNPIPAEIAIADGSLWKNVVTEAKSHAASTLQDFRGNYQYNLMDACMRRFHSAVPLYVQWDDHETTNNWYPQQVLRNRRDGAAYDALETARELAGRAKQAFFEYTPIRPMPSGERRIYRKIARGPRLDLFVLDFRTHRGPNTENRQTTLDDGSAILGAEQLQWLKQSLLESRATWKVLCCDMPIGVIIGDGMEGKPLYEAVANGDSGAPSGRELEIAELLRWMHANDIRNTVWITADIHYAAAHHYHPKRAEKAGAFKPFWEFVAGPLHAGTFGPNELDGTFGPEVKFQWAPAKGTKLPLAPSAGMQSFGTIRIDGRTGNLKAEFRGLDGQVLPSGTIELEPE